jgi:hypothetical protein
MTAFMVLHVALGVKALAAAFKLASEARCDIMDSHVYLKVLALPKRLLAPRELATERLGAQV